MTLLIIGGLLVVAILAILGAIFLTVSDQRAEKAQTTGSIAVNSLSATPFVEQSSTASKVVERTTPPRQILPPPTEKPLGATGGSQQQYALDGQFHELALELQTLHQHAWELERRLRTLAEVSDRIEKTQSNQIGAGEEMHSQSSADHSL